MHSAERPEDRIRKLFQETAPASQGPQPPGAACPPVTIQFHGGTNFVQISVANAADHRPELLAAIPDEPTAVAPRDKLIAEIKSRSIALGRPDLHLRFARSIYATSRLDRLSDAQLRNALNWLRSLPAGGI